MAQPASFRSVTVQNAQGLHARPADLLVKTANQFDASIEIIKDGEHADAKSILSIMTLAASQGTELHLRATGREAEAALEALVELFEQGFDDQASPTR